MPVRTILLRGGSHDGQRRTTSAHPDTLFRIEDEATSETYGRVDDIAAEDGTPIAVFRLDPSGEIVAAAQRRFAPATLG